MFNVSDPFSHLSDPAPKINNSFGHNDNSLFFQPHLISPSLGDTLSMSPDLRYCTPNSQSKFEPKLISIVVIAAGFQKSIQYAMSLQHH